MKKLSFKWVLPIMAMPMLMASCNSDETCPEVAEYVTIDRVGVGELQSRSEISATNNLLNSKAHIQLWFDSGKDDTRYNATRMHWSCNGSSWSTSEVLLWGGGSAKYIALCSDQAWGNYDGEWKFGWQEFIDDYRFSINSSALSNMSVKSSWPDILVAQGTATSSSLNLKFSHALAKVKINTNIPTSETYSDFGAIMYNLCTGAECSVSVTDGLKFYLENQSLDQQSFASDNTGEYYTLETLVIPQSANDLTIKINLYNPGNSTDYVVKFDNTQTFESGKIYEYDVVLGDSKAELENVTVSQWDDEVNAGNFVTE